MVVKYVSLIGMLWVMQVLLFAFRLRWAAPLQFIAVIAGAISMRSLGCALRGQAACADAARQLCSLLEDISMETLAPLPPWRPGDSRLCREAALEYWVAVVFAFCSLMPVSGRAAFSWGSLVPTSARRYTPSLLLGWLGACA